jgi:PD-(D/E)XK endonuclease
MISNPTSKGKTSEAVILAALVKPGKHVLIPWGEGRYDLAIDDDGRLVWKRCFARRSAPSCGR